MKQILDSASLMRLVIGRGHVRTAEIAEFFDVSRQRAQRVLKAVVEQGGLIKIGTTRNASYALPEYAAQHLELFPTKYSKRFSNNHLEEHLVLNEIKERLPGLQRLSENVRSIFEFAFSEMLNNAIEHSQSAAIGIEVSLEKGRLDFIINDFGIGVFKNIMSKKHLADEREAIQELMKGKTTTMPKQHSGEGIFFTSKTADSFLLESFGYELFVDNVGKDIFVGTPDRNKKGTQVNFSISIATKRHLNDLFREYASEGNDFAFDHTKIDVKLYASGGINVSRSQARRVLSNLSKFRTVTLDFDKVPMIGQAFADEVFRVFRNAHPEIKINWINANEGVRFMIERAMNTDISNGQPSLFR